ncbi:hypothetical protein LshimejAT787_2000670 [Lyophyllum shimeji]|uniref:Uncharacterized protein n=1 Tax=Lyophyllum shimeji TaxID=47721 RepID=A0A9P3UUH6_LYOSH|nr:hypothetical protein LshimejAT787_2000670 [Lyophyllum shimeji]
MSASTLQRSIVEGKAIRNKAAKEESTLFNTAPSRIERNHLHFYGFALNEAWVMQYARANLTGVGDQNYWCILTWVMDHLRIVTNHDDINVQPAKIDDETPANATVYEPEPGVKHIAILCICEFHKEAWPRRPTLAQVKELTEIMGTEPRWWTDFNPFEYYE